jgi:hypothetical protein
MRVFIGGSNVAACLKRRAKMVRTHDQKTLAHDETAFDRCITQAHDEKTLAHDASAGSEQGLTCQERRKTA